MLTTCWRNIFKCWNFHCVNLLLGGLIWTAQSVCERAFSLQEIAGLRRPGSNSSLPCQRKTTCIISIRNPFRLHNVQHQLNNKYLFHVSFIILPFLTRPFLYLYLRENGYTPHSGELTFWLRIEYDDWKNKGVNPTKRNFLMHVWAINCLINQIRLFKYFRNSDLKPIMISRRICCEVEFPRHDAAVSIWIDNC